MIIQGTNNPIVFSFPESMSNILAIEIGLFSQKQSEIKHWNINEVEISDNVVIASVTQNESLTFPAGNCMIEIKWVEEDGSIAFAKNIPNFIVPHLDKTLMTGVLGAETKWVDKVISVEKDSTMTVTAYDPVSVNMASEVIYKQGYSPYIDSETGNWFEYNDSAKNFVDTGVSSTFDIKPIEDEEIIDLF